jgi:quinol-cytochrome oxidoreductase complex cytochrome b subunit
MPKDPTDPVARLCEQWVKEQQDRKNRGIPVWAIQTALIVVLAVVFAVLLGLMVFYRPA